MLHDSTTDVETVVTAPKSVKKTVAKKKVATKKVTSKPAAKKSAAKKTPAKKAARKTAAPAEAALKPTTAKKAVAKKAVAAKGKLYLAKDTYKAMIAGLMDQGLEHADAVETLKVGMREANGIPVPSHLRVNASAVVEQAAVADEALAA